jgi:hypothetical protein
MGFSDTVKELLDQGIQVSKELAVKAGEKAQVWGEKGLEASKDFAAKAGAKVQELGEKSVLMLEIKQLEGQTKKLIAGLGAEVYKAYEGGAVTVDLAEDGIKTLLSQISQVKGDLEKRDAELQAKGKA